MELCWIILFRNFTYRKLSFINALKTFIYHMRWKFCIWKWADMMWPSLWYSSSLASRIWRLVLVCKLLKVFTLYPLVECHFKYDLIRSGIDFCINSDQYSMGTFLNAQKITWSNTTSSVTVIVLVIPGHHNETLKRFMGWRNQTALFNFVSCPSNQWAHHNCSIKWVIVMTNSSTWPWAQKR